MINEQKFLVTWVEANGTIRGQAVKTEDDANRMYDWLTSQETLPQAAEIRRIGRCLRSFTGPTPKVQPCG